MFKSREQQMKLAELKLKGAGCKQAAWKNFFKMMHSSKVTAFTVKFLITCYQDVLQVNDLAAVTYHITKYWKKVLYQAARL